MNEWRWVSRQVTDQTGSCLRSFGTFSVGNPGKQRDWITHRGEIDLTISMGSGETGSQP